MVTVNRPKPYSGERELLVLTALSTDTLPTDKIDGMPILNGSQAVIIDPETKKVTDTKIFDEENHQWCSMPSMGGVDMSGIEQKIDDVIGGAS